MTGPILTRREGGILEVTIDRPKANAIDLKTSRLMGETFRAFRDDPELRVAIVKTAGEKFFSAGWDLKAAADGDAVDGDYGVGGFGGLQELRDLNKPVIACVSGMAVGGGFELALSCDLIYAADHSSFALPEIRAVMGHEMGHYKLNHGIKLAVGFTIALGIGYFVVNYAFGRIQRRHGERWGIRDLADPAGLPLAFAILTVAMYLLTPVTNSLVRTAEHQADAFGLDAAREPHGFASVAMRLGTYRKLGPGALEEVIFFDHPSGRRRVARAMQWLADHPPAP